MKLHVCSTELHTHLNACRLKVICYNISDLLFFLLQVESLTAARKSAMQGQEPSDAIRVVNALLTQIDHIKRYSILSGVGS